MANARRPSFPVALYSTYPVYIDSHSRKIFAIHYMPDQDIAGSVVFAPPFAEEMNKCRPMMTRQARWLADLGYSAIVFDLYGTGDSEGEFGTATWNNWVCDLSTIVRSDFVRRDRPLWLIGVRLGALLALDMRGDIGADVYGMVLWNPVAIGKTHINQFLRLRLASEILAPEHQRESLPDLRQQLRTDKFIEVAGYELGDRLVNSIDALQIDKLISSEMKIWLIETTDRNPRKLSPTARQIVDRSRNRGTKINAMTVDGPPFWATQETAIAPNLIEQTANIIIGAT